MFSALLLKDGSSTTGDGVCNRASQTETIRILNKKEKLLMEQFSAFEEQFSAVEEQCVEDLQLDFTPLHDIVRIFSGFDKLLPTEKEFLMALDFIGYLIGKYRVVAQNGPDGEPLTQPTTELLQWLKSMWYQGKYDEINYGIWFTI